MLKGWMLSNEHFHYPYPKDEEKQQLVNATGITLKQLNNWFSNARSASGNPSSKSASGSARLRGLQASENHGRCEAQERNGFTSHTSHAETPASACQTPNRPFSSQKV